MPPAGSNSRRFRVRCAAGAVICIQAGVSAFRFAAVGYLPPVFVLVAAPPIPLSKEEYCLKVIVWKSPRAISGLLRLVFGIKGR